MFVIRNAGNLVPHSVSFHRSRKIVLRIFIIKILSQQQFFQDEHYSCESAGLELGCIVNDIRHIIVCGHSDCKAMNLLYQLQDPEFSSKENRVLSPLRSWLKTHAQTSLEKFQHLLENGLDKPLTFVAETPQRKFIAYIDPDHRFALEDKLSQINTLQQVQNVASYGFLKRRLEQHDLHIHALWFDIYSGDIYYFSRQSKRFITINEDTVEKIVDEVHRYYS